MEIRSLEAFVAVAEELHFGRAAVRLRMAQSPLSQTIRRLERELGVSLFDRSTRSVSLTPAGEALLPHAHRVFEEIERGRQATRAVSGELYGTLSIGFSGALNHRSLPVLTRAVRQRHPGVTLRLVGRVLTRDGVTQLESGALDLAFVALPMNPSAVVTGRLIARERLGVVLPSDHRLTGERDIELADLADSDFIAIPVSAGSGLQEAGVRACVAAGFRPRVVQEISDPFMILTLAAAGVGVALMPAGVTDILPSGVVFRPLRGASIAVDHAIAWSTTNPSPVLSAVLAVAAEVLPRPAD